MPSPLHNRWKRTKDNLAKARGGKGINNKPLDDALKSFGSGFGPLLDEISKAFKANKGGDVKKHATSALQTAAEYKKVLDTIPLQAAATARFELEAIVKVLKEIESNGMTARPELF